MTQKIDPIRETNEEAIELVKVLLNETKYASLAVNEENTGYPLVSRVAACWASSAGLFFAASDLSVHSKMLAVNGKCSILLGEVGKGDGLAHPRMTVVGQTTRMDNGYDHRNELKACFLKTHPKAELYIDFADFGFYPLSISRILLNGGFGKAYHLENEDLAFLKG